MSIHFYSCLTMYLKKVEISCESLGSMNQEHIYSIHTHIYNYIYIIYIREYGVSQATNIAKACRMPTHLFLYFPVFRLNMSMVYSSEIIAVAA